MWIALLVAEATRTIFRMNLAWWVAVCGRIGRVTAGGLLGVTPRFENLGPRVIRISRSLYTSTAQRAW